MQPCIIGWGHTKFGALRDQSLEDLILAAARDALEHAGVAAAEVDGIWLGHFNSGMVPDGFASSLVLGLDPVVCYRVAEHSVAEHHCEVHLHGNTVQLHP